jgi:hypothetical protein
MVWTLTGREPRFPRLRRLLNWTVLIGGIGVGIYFLWPLVGDQILDWLSSLLGGQEQA